MKKKSPASPIPPLSFETLTVVQDFEEYARQSLHGCGTAAAYNGEKALRILRTCVVESLDVQIAFYSSLPNYTSEWIKEISERTMSAIISLVGISGAEYWDYFWDEVRQTVKEHLRTKLRAVKDASNSKTLTQPVKTVSIAAKDAPVNNRNRIEQFILRMADSGMKITRKNIWVVAGYKDPTEFERFQRGSDRNQTANATFNRVLCMEPDVFSRILKQKSS